MKNPTKSICFFRMVILLTSLVQLDRAQSGFREMYTSRRIFNYDGFQRCRDSSAWREKVNLTVIFEDKRSFDICPHKMWENQSRRELIMRTVRPVTVEFRLVPESLLEWILASLWSTKTHLREPFRTTQKCRQALVLIISRNHGGSVMTKNSPKMILGLCWRLKKRRRWNTIVRISCLMMSLSKALIREKIFRGANQELFRAAEH